MFKSINKGKRCFTGARYNILRVVAAYPLDANFTSRSADIADAMSEDKHPLATLRHASLLAALATCDSTPSILSSLTTSLKRARGQVDEPEDVELRSSKSRKKSSG